MLVLLFYGEEHLGTKLLLIGVEGQLLELFELLRGLGHFGLEGGVVLAPLCKLFVLLGLHRYKYNPPTDQTTQIPIFPSIPAPQALCEVARVIIRMRLRGSYFNVADEIGLVESEQHFFTKHEIKSFMLYMRIG